MMSDLSTLKCLHSLDNVMFVTRSLRVCYSHLEQIRQIHLPHDIPKHPQQLTTIATNHKINERAWNLRQHSQLVTSIFVHDSCIPWQHGNMKGPSQPRSHSHESREGNGLLDITLDSFSKYSFPSLSVALCHTCSSVTTASCT